MIDKGHVFFTSESVTEGHPDKMADQISDAVLDTILGQDPNARVACETTLTTGLVMLAGEITANCYVDFQKIVRDAIKEIGYTRAKYGFDCNTCSVISSIHEQSPDIAMGVDESLESKEKNICDKTESLGAGDQGIMFGYAVKETEELMPLPITLAHKLAKKLSDIRKDGILDYLRPDGKTQVTVEYVDGKPARVDTIVISIQHNSEVEHQRIEHDIKKYVVQDIIPAKLLDERTKFYINPTGRFVIGGPHGDAGLTGRKIIVDTYGGMGRHGGGAFSGKDSTKVDRSATYAARWVAKNVVAAGISEKCEVQLSYAIGVSHPTSIAVNTFGTSKIEDEQIVEIINKVFDLRPGAIIRELDLRRPIFKQTAAYGHFGRLDLDLPWERTNRVDEIKLCLAENC